MATTQRSTQTVPTPARARGRPRTRRQDALALLKDDHRKIKAMFKRFDKLAESSPERGRIVDTVCSDLKVHAQLEEELFYPRVRGLLGQDEVLIIDEAQVEHDVAKQLIARIEKNRGQQHVRDAAFIVLCEYILHHAREEENEIFPRARKSQLDLHALGAELLERRRSLRVELGIEQAPAGMKEERPAHAALTH